MAAMANTPAWHITKSHFSLNGIPGRNWFGRWMPLTPSHDQPMGALSHSRPATTSAILEPLPRNWRTSAA